MFIKKMKDVTLELVEMIFKVTQLMKKEITSDNKKATLSAPQFYTLMLINRRENISMSEVASDFHIELPSATSMINKLSKLGLVRRIEDENDRRLVRLTLTKKGKMVLRKATNQRKNKLKGFLSQLSDDNKLKLLSVLQSSIEKLQNKNED